MTLLQRVPGVVTVEVRSKEELASVVGLIIPGGESTVMAHVAQRWGLIPELQGFAQRGNPIWGTCAGMIFLAERAEGMKSGGQALVGGLDITVSRNFFGAQINSFETQLTTPECLTQFGGGSTFRALFIRAPAVMQTGESVQVLASYTLSPEEAAAQGGRSSVAVAVRSGVLLATAFHPELTTDLRWHQLFVEMVRAHASSSPAIALEHAVASLSLDSNSAQQQHQLGRAPNRPNDLPIFGITHLSVEAVPA
ncbi:MAG: hypothetical protein WDW38_008990 [Sanguina aurantia]